MVKQKGLTVSLGLVCGALLLSGCGSDEEADAPAADEVVVEEAVEVSAVSPQDGPGLWATCVSCHGAGGEGNRELGAPSLVNQDPWYLKRQLQLFRSGARGSAPGDTMGSQMASMAQALPDDAAIDTVVAYIVEELPKVPPASTFEADVVNGRDHYDMICGACHGPGAEGNELLNAPRLAGIDDWYLVEQYGKFAQGMRGAGVDDKYGQQMQMMAKVLPDQETLHNVVAYIQSQAVE